MRCINKACVAALSCVIFLTGCASSKFDMPYDINTTISAYSFDTSDANRTADSFASDLCVVSDDVSEGTDVDMSKATAAVLFDTARLDTIYAKNAHKTLYPASMTKVLTALIAMKYGQMDDILTASQNVLITESGAQLCGFKPGDTMTLDQALHGLLMYSGNDAGVVIAEHISGSVEDFALLMNEEAKKLGATNSNFVNPHGLTDDKHYTTAYDMYLIFNEAMKYEKFKEIIHMSNYTSTYHDSEGNEKEMEFSTTNLFLTGTAYTPDNVTVIGGKTGTTNAAGACLVLLSQNNAGEPFISVVMQAEDRDTLYVEMSNLLQEIN